MRAGFPARQVLGSAGQGQEEGHAGQTVLYRWPDGPVTPARAEALGLFPGVTAGQHGVCRPGGHSLGWWSPLHGHS